MIFPFDNFKFFLVVYLAVLLDTLFGVFQAKVAGKFNWEFLPEFVNTMIKYTIYLAFANIVEYYASMTGVYIDGFGIKALAGILICVEGASIKSSIDQLTGKKP